MNTPIPPATIYAGASIVDAHLYTIACTALSAFVAFLVLCTLSRALDRWLVLTTERTFGVYIRRIGTALLEGVEPALRATVLTFTIASAVTFALMLAVLTDPHAPDATVAQLADGILAAYLVVWKVIIGIQAVSFMFSVVSVVNYSIALRHRVANHSRLPDEA